MNKRVTVQFHIVHVCAITWCGSAIPPVTKYRDDLISQRFRMRIFSFKIPNHDDDSLCLILLQRNKIEFVLIVEEQITPLRLVFSNMIFLWATKERENLIMQFPKLPLQSTMHQILFNMDQLHLLMVLLNTNTTIS